MVSVKADDVGVAARMPMKKVKENFIASLFVLLLL
jgi:hypothetical protein